MANPPGPEDQELTWTEIMESKLAESIVDKRAPVTDETLVTAWLSRIDDPVKKRKMMKIHEDVTKGVLRKDFVYIQQVQVKTDELLMRFSAQGYPEFKPRAIVNVHPVMQYRTGPEVYSVTQILKEEWPMEPDFFQIRNQRGSNLTMSISFGCGVTDRSLDTWMHVVTEYLPCPGAALLISGDDALVALRLDPQQPIVFIESDLSMCDQSTSITPLLFQYDLMMRLGMSKEVAEYLAKMSCGALRVRSHDGLDNSVVNLAAYPMRLTGGADTTVGNSIVVAASWVWYVLNTFSDVRVESIAAFMLRLGFKVKVRVQDHTGVGMTFLKGIWYPTSNGPHWGLMPSRLLKLGKSFKNPQQIYQLQSPQEAAAHFLSDQAIGIRNFFLPPLLMAFVHKFAHDAWEVQQKYNPSYDVKAQACFYTHAKFTQDCESMLNDRYGCTSADWAEVIILVERSGVYAFLEHPLLLRMAQVDY
jgi:hypothetical protein